MRSLLGDHFLRWFAGDLKRRLQVQVSKNKKINVETDRASASDENAAEENHEEAIVDGEEIRGGEGK